MTLRHFLSKRSAPSSGRSLLSRYLNRDRGFLFDHLDSDLYLDTLGLLYGDFDFICHIVAAGERPCASFHL